MQQYRLLAGRDRFVAVEFIRPSPAFNAQRDRALTMQTAHLKLVDVDDEVGFWKQAVERRLDVLMAPMNLADGSVCHAMHSGVTGRGKRIRALMLIGVGQGLGLDPQRLLDLACAVEMVHAASLYLDDLPCMDDAKERRGQPALHMKYGESTALLASMGMLTEAFKTIAEADDVPVHLRPRLVTLLADTVGPCGLIQGQFRDLATNSENSNLATLNDVNELKTGMLFRAAMLMPAMVAESSAETIEAITRFASNVGQAFQLQDDLADGRTTADGILADLDGHVTLVTTLGFCSAIAKLERHVKEARKLMHDLFRNSRMLDSLMQRIVNSQST